MDAHNWSQQNTWKLFDTFDTLSIPMSYRKYNAIILDCLSEFAHYGFTSMWYIE